MTTTEYLAQYESRCRALADAARARGIVLKKRDDAYEVEAVGSESSVAFRVVSDEIVWKQTSTEAAFYAAMQDAKSFKRWNLDDDLLAILDEVERAKLPVPTQEAIDQKERLRALSTMLGGPSEVDAFLEPVVSF